MADLSKNEPGLDPTSCRDYTKEFNQARPTSLRSSGTELDPCCEGGMNSENGLALGKDAAGSLDEMVREIDGGKGMSTEGESLSKKTAPASAFKVAERTKIADSPNNPLQSAMDPVFRPRRDR